MPSSVCQRVGCAKQIQQNEGLSIIDHSNDTAFRACSVACLSVLSGEQQNRSSTIVYSFPIRGWINTLQNKVIAVIHHQLNWYFHPFHIMNTHTPNEREMHDFLHATENNLFSDIRTRVEEIFLHSSQ
jgi:hypothetical protein